MHDSLAELARYYDVLMAHVNYDRWYTVAAELATLLPKGFRHLDVACGTCVLLERLLQAGWHSTGIDLSEHMLREGMRRVPVRRVAAADMRALPFAGCFDYITCLFDSINFLMTPEDLEQAFSEMARALTPRGILYFDVVTERMIVDHFAGRRWTERSGKITTTWESSYRRSSGLVETQIVVKNGPECVIRERIFPREIIVRALETAGLTLLCMLDAETWQPVHRKSVRIDFLACKDGAAHYGHVLDAVIERVRALMK